jgi:L-ascorbate metabolism protein UlaG (beta-lactamase superfamily)
VISGSIIRKEFLTNGQDDFDFRRPNCPPLPTPPSNAVEVRHLGSGGVAIRWRDDIILLGPYFSRPGSVGTAQFGLVQFDDVRIAAGMRPIDVGKVRAILTGHSHFDHIGDVPRIVTGFTPRAVVYTNTSGVKMLAAYPDIRAQSLADSVGKAIRLPGSRIRFTTIESDHAPQLCRAMRWPCTFARGEVKEPWTTDWTKRKYIELRGGATYAFVIDLLNENDTVHFRIYYNDAAAAPPKGIPPDLLTPVDLAVVCMASFNFIDDYPEALLRALQPRHVMLSHFEDFFSKQDGSWMFVPLMTDAKAHEFMKRMRAVMQKVTTPPRPPATVVCGPMTERWSMPVPGWPLYFVA